MKRWMLMFVLAVGVLASAQKPRDFTSTECAGYYVIWADAYHRNERVLNPRWTGKRPHVAAIYSF